MRGFGSNTFAGYLHPAPSAASAERSTRPVKVPSGRVWPNGEFGLGYAIKKQESDAFRPNPAGGVSVERIREECATITDGAEPLDLTSLPNSRKDSNRPESYGRKGVSSYGAKMVRNAGYLLQERYGRRNLTFLTLTLPSMEQGAAARVSQTWGETVNRLLEWLNRRLARAGLPAKVALVTEIQSERFASGDSNCLHVHVVFVGKKPGKSWGISVKDMRAWWCDRLSRVTGGEVYSPSCCDMKPVKKDAGNYLSKYMSKGTELISEYADRLGWDAVPRQWWNVTKPMRAAIKRACLSSDALMALLDEMVYSYYSTEDQTAFKFVRAVEVRSTEMQSFVVGFWGRLTAESVKDLTDLAAALKCS